MGSVLLYSFSFSLLEKFFISPAILNDVLQEICVQRKEIKPTLDKYAQQLKALQNEAK